MRIAQLSLIIAVAALPAFAATPTYRATGTDAASWARIFASIGMMKSGIADPMLVVAGAKDMGVAQLAQSHIVILEGNTAASQSLGFVAKAETVEVRRICDVLAPKMNIIWEQAVSVPAVDVPTGFQVFATEKWKGIPVLAG